MLNAEPAEDVVVKVVGAPEGTGTDDPVPLSSACGVTVGGTSLTLTFTTSDDHVRPRDGEL